MVKKPKKHQHTSTKGKKAKQGRKKKCCYGIFIKEVIKIYFFNFNGYVFLEGLFSPQKKKKLFIPINL